ncbi:hypothetical protein [Mesorhizobium sp.]|uniref:DUF7002 family protein n=1 Tax=Mesorhizobium sp. TaxID=1871066 RepID=UPI0025DBB927|nr:hypothetical protein [Mesorhizobium sp.]
MSAAALLDDYGVNGDLRHQLGSCRRPNSVPLAAEGRPGTVLRDQKPMDDGRLARCLDDGLTPRDWYELLNSRTFFWLSRSRIWGLLRARAYRNVPQTVLTLDTKRLVAAHRDRIWLSPINSGATLFKPQRRGLATFQRVADFPFDQRAKTRRLEDNVVELVVDHSVPDVANYVLAVHEVRDDQILSEIWCGPEGGPGDHP